jgi:hypothetical protein
MHRVLRSSFSFAVLLALASLLPAQNPRALTHDDYDGWKSLRGTSYAQDGSWVAYAIEPQWGDGVLEVREVAGPGLHRLERGSNPRFSADGRFVVFTRVPSKVAERDKKIAELRKKAKEATKSAAEKAAEKEAEPKSGEASAPAAAAGEGPRRGGRRPGGGGPGGSGTGAGGPGAAPGGDEAAARERGELCVLELATGALEVVGKVKGSTVSDDAPFLLIHKEKPEPKPGKQDEAKAGAAPASPESSPSEAPKPEVAQGEPTEAKPEPAASGEAKPPAARAAKAKDPLEGKRPEGTELVVRDLRNGQERVLADVVAYGLSGKGRWLWYHTSHKQPKRRGSYGLFVEPLAGGKAVQVLDGIAHVGGVTFDRSEQVLAFTSDKEDFAADKPASDLYLWEGGEGPARRIAYAGASGMPAGKRVAGSLAFSRDGSTLSFDVHDAPAPGAAADPARGQGDARPVELARRPAADPAAEARGRRTQSCVDGDLAPRRAEARRARRRRAALAALPRPFGGPAARHRRPQLREGDDLGRPLRRRLAGGRQDRCAHARAREAARQRQHSPGGRYLLWFGAGLPLVEPRCHDRGPARPDRRPAGAVPPPRRRPSGTRFGLRARRLDRERRGGAGARRVRRVEDHAGERRRGLRHRRPRPRQSAAAACAALPRDDDRPWVDDELLLAAVHVDTMAEGLLRRLSLLRNQLPKRSCSTTAASTLVRPKQATRLFFTRSTFATFPDLWTANADFGGMRRLSDANPQQKDYRWGNAELVHWVDGDGKPRQGVLVKPDGFDPTKRYPMMVHFYERMTQGLHNYVAPAPGTSPNASYYASNGWLWFMPDVVYEVGYPGNSCVKCVDSAACSTWWRRASSIRTASPLRATAGAATRRRSW